MRGVGHVGWWVFVVAAVFAQLIAPPAVGAPRRYADYLPAEDFGWTAYTPLTDGQSWAVVDGEFAASNFVSTVALIGLVVAVVAAIVESVLGKRWGTGIVTVLTTIVGAALVLFDYLGELLRISFDAPIALALVLCGVAIREVWSRRFAPTRIPPAAV